MQSFDSMIVKTASCLADERTGTKEDLHGMNVMYQLSKTCPNAELYSYRVASASAPGSEPEPDKDAVIAALKLAIKDEVDIVNMSFGWLHWKQEVHDALVEAQKAGILLFASVSNSGALGPMRYPAIDDAVFAVDAADASGNPAPFNSPDSMSERKTRYTAPGVNLKGVTQAKLEGTSFASPILAGVAALFLEFAKQDPLARTKALEYAKKKAGMHVLLDMIVIQKTADRFSYVTPWALFYDDHGNHGGDGEPDSRRYRVAGMIVDKLVQRFGTEVNIGSGVFR